MTVYMDLENLLKENQIDGTYNIVDNPEKFTLEME